MRQLKSIQKFFANLFLPEKGLREEERTHRDAKFVSLPSRAQSLTKMKNADQPRKTQQGGTSAQIHSLQLQADAASHLLFFAISACAPHS